MRICIKFSESTRGYCFLLSQCYCCLKFYMLSSHAVCRLPRSLCSDLLLLLIFGAPLYNFSVRSVGLLDVAGLIISILGFVSGTINGFYAHGSRRNNGTYEPEVRFRFRFGFADCSAVRFPCRYRSLRDYEFLRFRDCTQQFLGWTRYVSVYPRVRLSFLDIVVYGYTTDYVLNHALEAFASINLRNIYSFGLYT
jgi:hypothetical protein